MDAAIDRHDGSPFELRALEALVEVTPADAQTLEADKDARDATAEESDSPDSPASDDSEDGDGNAPRT